MACYRYRAITDEDEIALAEMVSQGLEFMQVREKLPLVRLHDLRNMYTHYRRAATWSAGKSLRIDSRLFQGLGKAE